MSPPISEEDLDLEPFFRLSHDNLCIAGYDGYFRRVNPAFIKLMGYSEEELLSFPISDLVHPQDKHKTAETRAQVLEDNPLLHFENRYITKSGGIVWLIWTSIPMHDKKLIYAISKNITHIKKLEEERLILFKNHSTLNSDLKQLAYTISHDLRSPVSNMLSLFSLLDLSTIKDEDSLLYLKLLEESVHELKDTLNAQLEHLKDMLALKAPLEQVELEKVLQSTIGSIRSLITDSKTTFEVDFSEMKNVMGNSFYLNSIFLNLISNSIKYAKPGIPPKIRITSKQGTDFSQLLFSDNGIGFNMEKNGNKIFGLNQVFTDKEESKGIGLYLVKNYMENLGGSIEVSSEPNMGSTFTLKFKNGK